MYSDISEHELIAWAIRNEIPADYVTGGVPACVILLSKEEQEKAPKERVSENQFCRDCILAIKMYSLRHMGKGW